jgi:hypothetical protein
MSGEPTVEQVEGTIDQREHPFPYFVRFGTLLGPAFGHPQREWVNAEHWWASTRAVNSSTSVASAAATASSCAISLGSLMAPAFADADPTDLRNAAAA